MFGRSSSSHSLHDAKEHPSGSGGLLQGFRKKTLLRMSRSSSMGSTSAPATTPVHSSTLAAETPSPGLERQEVLDARTRYFFVLMKRFQEQDYSLRLLEAELADMLTQFQNACGAMMRTVEAFTQTFRYDATSYTLGVDYLAVVKKIASDGVEMMDQSIRFTVLDPILARLERHNQLKGGILAWERLYSEVVELQLSLEQLRGAVRTDREERRRQAEHQRLLEMQDQLADLQDTVTPLIEETTETYPAESQVQLFDSMEFELGKSPPEAFVAPTENESDNEWQSPRGFLQEPFYPFGDVVNLLELASNPVVPDYSEDTDKQLFFECASFLPLEDIARLANVDHLLHASIRKCSPIWKQCIRARGISPPLRCSVWLSILYGKTPWQSGTSAPHHLSVAETRVKIYEQLLMKVGSRMASGSLSGTDSASVSEERQQLLLWLHEIDVDVTRTCNKDIYARDVSPTASSRLDALRSPTPKSAVEAKIRRVLRAYTMYNPRVGYCQGMNFLVRVLLEVTANEADVFWLFVGLSEPEINRNLYEPGLAMLQPLLAKFELLVSYHMPELHAHFQREGVHVAAFSTRWFMTLFTSFETFGPAMVLRVLDLFVIDGWRVLLSMGLVVLDELREALLAAELEGILRILQFPRSYMAEPDQARRQQLVRHALAFCVTRAINTLQ
ncbi:hypothetical protein PybrP1_006568 [[Pythium] brassicae (nom. inval.)]|nr:hypothetical protein PybrP1_006568 [[Pythium] brassicae (nom. inval.)]